MADYMHTMKQQSYSLQEYRYLQQHKNINKSPATMFQLNRFLSRWHIFLGLFHFDQRWSPQNNWEL